MEGKLKREVDKLSALHEIDRALATLDLRDCFKIVVQRARSLFATDAVAILLREGETLRIVADDCPHPWLVIYNRPMPRAGCA